MAQKTERKRAQRERERKTEKVEERDNKTN